MRALLAAMLCHKGDVERNLAAHLGLLTEAAAEGCELALFPEMSLTGSADPAAHPEQLISLDHPAVAALAGATGETGVGGDRVDHHVGRIRGAGWPAGRRPRARGRSRCARR